jgi:hypothetical protein
MDKLKNMRLALLRAIPAAKKTLMPNTERYMCIDEMLFRE